MKKKKIFPYFKSWIFLLNFKNLVFKKIKIKKRKAIKKN